MTAPKLQILDLAQKRLTVLLSKASGVSEDEITRLSGGEIEIDEEVSDQLRSIARALRVDVLELFQPALSEETASEQTVAEWLERRSLSAEDMFLLQDDPEESNFASVPPPSASSLEDMVCRLRPNLPFCR